VFFCSYPSQGKDEEEEEDCEMKATQRRAEEQVGELLLPVIRLVHKAVDSSSPQSQR